MREWIDSAMVEYLKENKRLVIPDFGAFIRKDSGEVVFMEFLKKDDGVLLGLMQKSSGEGDRATKIALEEYVFEVKGEIARKGGYHIRQLGHLQKNRDGVYELIYSPGEAAQAEPQRAGVKSEPTAALKSKPDSEQTPPIKFADKGAVPIRESRRGDDRDKLERNLYGSAPSSYPSQPAQPIRSAKGGQSVTSPSQPQSTQPIRSAKSGERRADQVGAEYARRRPPTQPTRSEKRKRRGDVVMVIAILAAVLALLVMLFALITSNNPLDLIQSIQ